jgi:hypothetical protein
VITVMHLPSIQKTQHPLCDHSDVLTINTEDTNILCVITGMYLPSIQKTPASSMPSVMYLPSIQKTPASSVSSQLCTYHQYRRHQHPLCHHSYVLTINTEDTSILHAISYALTINTENTSILCVIKVMYLPSIQKTPASSV